MKVVARNHGVLGVRIARPIDQVLNTITTSALLESALEFVLDGAVGEGLRWQGRSLSGKIGIRIVGLEGVSMEGIADFLLTYCLREIQPEGNRRHGFVYTLRTGVLGNERTSTLVGPCNPVLRAKEDETAAREGARPAGLVRVLGPVGVRVSNRFSGILVGDSQRRKPLCESCEHVT